MPLLTREALYDLVWAEPVRTIAKRFGISDVGFKKHCVRAGVPVPERGYWAKIAAGKTPPKMPLPPREPGASNTLSIGKEPYRPYDDLEARLAEPVPERPVFPEPIEAVKARIVKRVRKAPYVRDLASPSAAVRAFTEEDEKRRERQRTSRFPSSWDQPLFDSGFEKRRLKILNSLALGLARAGVRMDVRGKVAREISVKVGDTHVSLMLDHPTAKPNRFGEWPTREGPGDTLRLQIGKREQVEGYRAIWLDSDGAKLEGRLTEIVIDVITAGEVDHRHACAQHHAWLLETRAQLEAEVHRRREEAERKARERRLAEEKACRAHLFAQAQAWRTAQDIRGFVAQVLASPPGAQEREDVERWAAWALAEADALDPVASGSLAPPR